MIKFEFEIDHTNEIDPKLIKNRNGKLLVDIQGRLEVFVNDKCFFLEPSMALLEFGIALKKWDRKDSFYYYTMEHDEREGPILAFRKNEDNHLSLYSIWQLYESNEKLPLNLLIENVETFLFELDQALLHNYGLKVNDFIKKRYFWE